MQASYNITGQKNGSNFWIALVSSIISTMFLQNNSGVVYFRYDVKQSEKAPMKSRPDSQNYEGLNQHEPSRSGSRIKKTTQLSRGSGPRAARLASLDLTQLEMVLRIGTETLILNSKTEQEHACLGKPRSINSCI